MSIVSPATISRVLIVSSTSVPGIRMMNASTSTMNGTTLYVALLPVDSTSDGASFTVILEYSVNGVLYNVSSSASQFAFYQTVKCTDTAYRLVIAISFKLNLIFNLSLN